MYTSALVTFRDFAAVLDRWSAAEPPRIPDEWLMPYARAVTAHLAQIEHTDQRDQLLEEAFELLQRASPERLAITAEQIARERERMDPDYATLRETLRTARRAYELAQLSLAIEAARPGRARSRIEEDRLEAERRDAQTNFDNAQRALALRHASVQQLVLPPSVRAKALRPHLAADEALIQYLIGEGGSFGLVVRRDRVDLIALPAARRSSLETDIAELRTGLAGDRSPARPFDTALARRISNQVVNPLNAALEGVQRLQIVTGGALSALPLGLLPVSVQSTDSVSAQKWLIERYIISHTPSIAVFQSQRSMGARRDGRLRPALALGISRWGDSRGRPARAPVAADGPGSGLDRLNERCLDGKPLDPSLLAALPALPGIETELNALSRTLGHRGRALTRRIDDEATEQSFRSEALSDYALLYFATHAVLPGAARCLNEPAIALSAFGPGASRSDDGLLEASEVASLRLDADLVVLSACNTATRAQGLSGESLTGLAQAFFSAGARRVLASHWTIDSKRTAELMESTFSFQREGDYDDIAESLRHAQIKMLLNPATAHPWFWGGFTVLGTGPAAAAR
jgi:CHAT domain-containing protein